VLEKVTFIKERTIDESKIRIIPQQWNEIRSSMSNIIGTFYSHLMSNKIDEKRSWNRT
jgi:hypothetical protein